MVKPLLNDLFEYLKISKDLVLIKSCVFHYELEFIHPFMDDNGRLGRLWQTIILKEQYPVFEFLPVETIVKKKQDHYYKALSISDKSGSSTTFIEFMLLDSLEELLSTQNSSLSGLDRINLFKSSVGNNFFTRKDYLRNYKEICSRQPTVYQFLVRTVYHFGNDNVPDGGQAKCWPALSTTACASIF